MTKLYEIYGEDGFAIGPTFTSWEEARDYKNENQIPGSIRSFADPMEPESDPFPSNPEPQEMSPSWAEEMERNQ